MTSNTNLPQYLSEKDLVDPNDFLSPPPEAQLSSKLSQVCNLLFQLTEEQRQTNQLLRRLVSQEIPGGFKIVKLGNPDKPYLRFLVVLDNDRSHPRIDCPICNENVEITTAKRGGCKQQSFCGDYVVCNECSNDALQKMLRCPSCCENYSNVSVPICEHLAAAAATESEGHLARKGSGSGCPLCSNKLVKDKCPQHCARKELADYNMAKTILADKIFVLVKNPETCTDDNDRPCSHYCRCTKHNILFTNRNKGAKCRECTKESSKQRVGPSTPNPSLIAKRKRPPPSMVNSLNSSNSAAGKQLNHHQQNTQQMNMPAKRYCVNPSLPPGCIQNDLAQSMDSMQHHPGMQFNFLEQPITAPQPPPKLQSSVMDETFSYWPFPNISFSNVKELGRKVPNFDEIFERIPYSEGVVELGKRVGIIQEEEDVDT